jgi:hypothetical protein
VEDPKKKLNLVDEVLCADKIPPRKELALIPIDLSVRAFFNN